MHHSLIQNRGGFRRLSLDGVRGKNPDLIYPEQLSKEGWMLT